jgi:hypothetical protein
MCESAGRQVILILSKPGFLHYFLMHFAYSLSANHDPTALDRYNYTYNGEIYDPDDQCRQIQGDYSQLCRVSFTC